MVDNIRSGTQKREDRFQTTPTDNAMVVHSLPLVLVMPFGIGEAVPGTSGKEVEVLVEEGISSSSMGFGTGLYLIVDQMVESLSSIRVVDRTPMLEDEPEEDFRHAPTGKPGAVSAVTSEVSVHPRSLLGMVVSSDRASEPMGLPLPSHAPSFHDPQEISEEVPIGSMRVEVQGGSQIDETAKRAIVPVAKVRSAYQISRASGKVHRVV